VRVELAHSLEQLAARRVRDAHEHERHLLAGACQVRQHPDRPLRIAQALDAVLMGVALDELGLDVFEGVLVLVDGEEDGEGHLGCAHPSARRGSR
jgi:hypothetical protein